MRHQPPGPQRVEPGRGRGRNFCKDATSSKGHLSKFFFHVVSLSCVIIEAFSPICRNVIDAEPPQDFIAGDQLLQLLCKPSSFIVTQVCVKDLWSDQVRLPSEVLGLYSFHQNWGLRSLLLLQVTTSKPSQMKIRPGSRCIRSSWHQRGGLVCSVDHTELSRSPSLQTFSQVSRTRRICPR